MFGKVLSVHAIKANGGGEAELHAFLNLALHRDVRSVSHFGHFTSPSPTTEGDPTTHWIGGRVGSTDGMEASPSGNRIHDSWVVRRVVRHYTDCCLLVRKIIRRVQFEVLTRRWVSNNLVIYSEQSFCVTKEPFAVAECLSSVPGAQRVHTPAT